MVKNPLANAGNTGDAGSIPGLERYPGGGNGNPFQYSCLENSMDRGAWQATGLWDHKELDVTEHACRHYYFHIWRGFSTYKGEAENKIAEERPRVLSREEAGKEARSRSKIPKCYILFHISVTSEVPNYVVYSP